MPIQIEDVQLLRRYIERIMERADHHGFRVNEICLAVAGAVIWKADTLEARGRSPQDPKVILKMTVGNDTYALCFDHDTGDIEVRERNHLGQVIRTFSNQTPLGEVKTFFQSL